MDLYLLLFCAGILLLSGGCAWNEETGPEPVSAPYTLAVPGQKQTAAVESPRVREERILNEIISGISLQMTLSGKGPYRLLFPGKEISVLQRKVFHALLSMGMILPSAGEVLYCTVSRKKNKQEFRLGSAPGKSDFYMYSLAVPEKEKKNP